MDSTKCLLIVYFYVPQTVDCPITHGQGSVLNAEEIRQLTAGYLCGSLDACPACRVVSRPEQSITALASTAANVPLLRSRVGELT